MKRRGLWTSGLRKMLPATGEGQGWTSRRSGWVVGLVGGWMDGGLEAMLDSGCWMGDGRFWMLDSGCWIADARFAMVDSGCRMLGVERTASSPLALSSRGEGELLGLANWESSSGTANQSSRARSRAQE